MQLLHYKAEGLFGIQEYDKTVQVCKELLKLLPQNEEGIERKEVSELMKRAMMQSLKAQKLEEKLAAVRELDQQSQKKVIQEMKNLGLVIGPQAQQIPKSYPAKVTIDEEGFLHFPILFIYPEYKITDYITDAHELSLLRDQLKRILQEHPSWDKQNRYSWNTVDVFYQVDVVHPFKEFEVTHSNRMKEAIKVRGQFKRKYQILNPRLTVIEALRQPGHVIAQLPVLHIVAREGAHRGQFEKI